MVQIKSKNSNLVTIVLLLLTGGVIGAFLSFSAVSKLAPFAWVILISICFLSLIFIGYLTHQYLTHSVTREMVSLESSSDVVELKILLEQIKDAVTKAKSSAAPEAKDGSGSESTNADRALTLSQIPLDDINLKLTTEERASLINKLEKSAIEYQIETLKEELNEKRKRPNFRDLSVLRSNYERSIYRLSREISTLSGRGNVNLVIGGMTTFFGVILLLVIVVTADFKPEAEFKQLAFHYVPRVAIAISIEFFAFFFLKLYTRALDEIKYYQNEITNLDNKFLAIEAIISSDEKGMLGFIIESLSKTERNFRLQKDESTTEIEMAKIDSSKYKEIIGNLVNISRREK